MLSIEGMNDVVFISVNLIVNIDSFFNKRYEFLHLLSE